MNELKREAVWLEKDSIEGRRNKMDDRNCFYNLSINWKKLKRLLEEFLKVENPLGSKQNF